MTEQRFDRASDEPRQAVHVLADSNGGGGSVDDHVIDDQPAQPHPEPMLDLAALLESRPVRLGSSPTLSCPRRPALAILLPSYLEGPQRPPCATGLPA